MGQLQLLVFAVILSEAKDPDTLELTQTSEPFQPQVPTQLLF
jgi:hypothetical protein